MAAEAKFAGWAVHFPGNLRWSNAMQIVKGMAPYGAIAMEEVDRIGDRLEAREREGDPDTVWKEEWSTMANRVAKVADTAAAEGRQITAGHHYMRAANYYYSAERFIPPGDEKLAMYRKALRCWHAALERLYPQIERVEVPYEGQSLPAYFLPAPGPGPKRTVVLFDGMDNAKEMSVIFAGLDFAKRGINTLAIDGPGQSEALRLRQIHSRPDYEVAGRAAYDYVAARPDVDPKRVSVMGYSFGGYHAPRVAGMDKRYAGCIALGAMYWQMHSWLTVNHARLDADARKSSTSVFQFRWVVGAPDDAAALEMAKKFSLEGIAQQIECPVLILHGENDRIVPLSEARILYEKVGARNKTLRIFTADEGGAEHCQVDNRQLGIDYVGDWLLANT
ncbi:MAG TPA: alpha/beta fold hydrolase [Xanthobacteraceae bacterium]|nr:alpha/beta fold hydrolase [Xanthobacteraceae bacterium]